ncbi:MAG: ATP-binding cassette domain-containing protein [Crenarchaeota archaeon]|nr:ATP-binding cassette domain-containing protein [Thermoproteota archaeon]
MSRRIIEIENLQVRYPDSNSYSLVIDELEIYEGETVLVLGRSGSGKSTLGKTISGVIPHIEKGEVRGRLEVSNIDPRTAPIEDIVRRVAYLAQSPYDQVIFTRVVDEIRITIENIRGRADEKDVDHYLDLLGIGHLKYRNVRELSGGELQKLAIACILALDPEIIILDEPLAHLDPQSCREFSSIVEKLREMRKTLIIIEHRFRELVDPIDRGLIDRIVLLDNCKLASVIESREIVKNLKVLDSLGIILPLNCKLSILLNRELKSLSDLSIIEYVADLLSTLESRTERAREDNPLITIENLYAGYISMFRGLRRTVLWVLKNVTLRVLKGEVVGVVGPNGAGKSTLLRAILRIVPYIRGRIIIYGKEIKRIGDLRGLVGYVPQNPDLILIHDTVFREIFERARISCRNIKEAEKKAMNIARELGLSEVLHKCPHSLSRGQRFRVAIASVLALDPAVLLLDEPTVGQDEECIEKLGEIVKEHVRSGLGAIVVTHDLHFILDYVDRMYVLENGQVIAEGDPLDIMTSKIMDKIRLPVPDYVHIFKKLNVRFRPRELIEKISRRLCEHAS